MPNAMSEFSGYEYKRADNHIGNILCVDVTGRAQIIDDGTEIFHNKRQTKCAMIFS